MLFLFFVAENQRTNELTYSNMQIIAREVELQTMRRSAPKNGAANDTKAKAKPKPQNHLQRLNTKGVNSTAKTKDLVCLILTLRQRKKNDLLKNTHRYV